ncbi:peptidoglycan-associated lipoprotein Pal [Geobacter sp.]|uniref:peptidoglycan-associated lipoprotein Pal n=1 Tax=Geobacter sp. TaxID=46610 RepID=UPI0026287CE3|nr:peptidoglycan-associated lipoprotein Pal [Geobacter sp.]
MRTGTRGLVALLCAALMIAGGCAKKEIVKPEEGARMAAPTPPPAPAAPAPAKTEEPMAAQPVSEAAVKGEAPQEAVKGEEAEAALERIYFDFDSYVLSQQARDTLYRDAEILLKKQPAAKVSLEGHCDERGSDEYNLALGEKRAKAAMDYLVTLGVPAERLSTISYGKEKPLDPGHTEEAWAKNRRVELVIVK